MRNDAVAANPGGVEVDPEGLVAQYRGGVRWSNCSFDLKG